jgi:hypothetical protein
MKKVDKTRAKLNETYKQSFINLLLNISTKSASRPPFLEKANLQLNGTELKVNIIEQSIINPIEIGFIGTINNKTKGTNVYTNHTNENNAAGNMNVPTFLRMMQA